MAVTDPALPIVKNANTRIGEATSIPTRVFDSLTEADVIANPNWYSRGLRDEHENQGQTNFTRREARVTTFGRSQFGSGG